MAAEKLRRPLVDPGRLVVLGSDVLECASLLHTGSMGNENVGRRCQAVTLLGVPHECGKDAAG